jgi:hypothetical protein
MQKSAPSWSIIGKQKLNPKQSTPGPGDYKTSPSLPIRFPISKAPRADSKYLAHLPGPGSYSPNPSDPSPKVRYFLGSFPKSMRLLNNSSLQTPGPGDYQLPSTLATGPHYTIGSRKKRETESPSPGPGAYDPSVVATLERFPSVRIGRSKRMTAKPYFRLPGPGSYSLDFTSYNAPKWKFGSSKRKTGAVNHTPGPGDYEAAPQVASISYSISPSRRKEESSSNPGPGTYSPGLAEHSPRPVIGTSKRDSPLPGPTPGPGAYNVEMKKSSNSTQCKL